MGMERRGYIVQPYQLINQKWEESVSKEKPFGWDALLEGSRIYLPIGRWECVLRLDNKSRMNREVHVRFREGVGVKFPRATRLINL